MREIPPAMQFKTMPAQPKHSPSLLGATTATRKQCVRFGIVLLLSSLICGCSSETLDYTEVKRIDEQLTEAEIQTFLRIIDSLPDKQLPRFPLVFSLPTGWNQSRNLPVNVLLNEKKNVLNEHWSIDWLATHLDENRPLRLALRHEGYTPQQFIGLTLAIGVAMSRGTLREGQDLDRILTKGEAAIHRLKRETRPFSSLSKEGMYYVLREAVWITRVDRARHLKLVPPENVTMTAKHRKALVEIFPAEFSINPLDAIADLLEEQGVPFEELSESGTDDQIEWSPHDAIVGTDATPSK